MSDECAICFDTMTAETGHCVLGCGHRFHMLCVVNWFQEQEGNPSCPCCRRGAGKYDNVPVWPEEELAADGDILMGDDEFSESDARTAWVRAEGGRWECYTIPTAPDFVWDPATERIVPDEITAGAVALQRIWRGWRQRRRRQHQGVDASTLSGA